MNTDPVRLLSENGDAFALSLLKAGRDHDTVQARSRKAVVLGAASGAAASGLALGVGVSSKSLWAIVSSSKWLYLGAFLGTTAIATVALWPSHRPLSAVSVAPNNSPIAVANSPYSNSAAALSPSTSAQSPTTTDENNNSSPGSGFAPSPLPPDATSVLRTPVQFRGDDVGLAPAAGSTLMPGPSDATSTQANSAPSPLIPAVSPNASAAVQAKSPSAGAEVVVAVPALATTSAASSDLAAEVSALRAARESLSSGQAARCLGLVDAYFGRFPKGLLSSEARLLRVEALSQSGRAAEAKSLARAMLVSNPQSPYAPRLRTIAGE